MSILIIRGVDIIMIIPCSHGLTLYNHVNEVGQGKKTIKQIENEVGTRFRRFKTSFLFLFRGTRNQK